MDNGIEYVVERLNRVNEAFERLGEMECPPPELEARLVRLCERLLVVALCRGMPPKQVCRWVDGDEYLLGVVVADRAREPVVLAARAARPEELAAALGALDD